MRSITFFSILTLLPSIISASPLAVVRRDNSSPSSLSDAATRLMAVPIDVGRQVVAQGLEMISSSSPITPILKNWQNTLQQNATFQAFDQTIQEMNCSYDLGILIPPAGSVEGYFIISLAWVSKWIGLNAESIVANATILGLSDPNVQMIQNAGISGNTLSATLLSSVTSPISLPQATESILYANWEMVHHASFFEPQCTVDPGIQTLGLPISTGGVSFDTPFIASPNQIFDFSGSCPNGKNDPNCFCQTINSNLSVPLIAPAQKCPPAVGPGLNTLYLTNSSTLLSLDPTTRTNQALTGSIVQGPLSFVFGATASANAN